MESFPGAEEKIRQYVERIEQGEEKETVLQGLGPAFREPVEEKLRLIQEKQNNEASRTYELRKELRNDTDESVREIEKVHGVEAIKKLIVGLGKNYYLFTHQTEEGVAKKIYDSEFRVSPGTGISGTMSLLGAESVANQIERQIGGDAHRGFRGMFIVAVPRGILDAQSRPNKAEVFEDVLLESDDYGLDGTPDIIIPKEYNLGYLQGEELYYNKNFI